MNRLGTQAEVLDKEASSYDLRRVVDSAYMSCMYLTAREVPLGTSICLDAGCGTGMSTRIVAERSQIVVAVDYSLESLKLLQGKAMENVWLVQADLNALPFNEEVLNLVFVQIPFNIFIQKRSLR